MITAVAFSCVSADGITVSGVELTPELKVSLGLDWLGSLIKRPFNYAAIEEVGTSGDGVKQRLDLVHTTAASIQLPPRALERDCPLRGISDILIYFDCLGICFYEFGEPGDRSGAVHNGYKAHAALGSFGSTANIRHGTVFGDEVANGQRGALRGHTPFRLCKKPDNFLRYSSAFGRDRVLKVVSQHKVRAMLLIEPPAHGRESRMCLYTSPVSSDEFGDPLE
jgi:hypothetical protein